MIRALAPRSAGGDAAAMKTAGLALALLAAAAALPSCGRREQAGGDSYRTSALRAAKERGKFIVLTEATFPPFEFKDEKGELQGFDIDLAKAIAKEAGLGIEF